jgi:hypothetical protein
MRWIGQVWRGEIPLGRAFWVFGVLIPVVLTAASSLLGYLAIPFILFVGMSNPSAPDGLLRGAAYFPIGVAVFTWTYQLVACVGVWRSAGTYPGRRVYSILAKVAVAGCVVVVVAEAVRTLNALIKVGIL